MRNTLRAMALISLFACHAAQAGEPNGKRTPPFANAIGVVTAIIHSANAYRAECSPLLSAKELMTPWVSGSSATSPSSTR